MERKWTLDVAVAIDVERESADVRTELNPGLDTGAEACAATGSAAWSSCSGADAGSFTPAYRRGRS